MVRVLHTTLELSDAIKYPSVYMMR